MTIAGFDESRGSGKLMMIGLPPNSPSISNLRIRSLVTGASSKSVVVSLFAMVRTLLRNAWKTQASAHLAECWVKCCRGGDAMARGG